MKLKEYIENLNEFVKEHPEALELDTIYAKDSEGNGYHDVSYTPTLMQVDEGYYREVQCDPDEDDFSPNAVCIN